ncbi:MAG: 3-phosphoserine/phosphohydroxythreonine transaminase [Ramlibacter sp.]|uniref:3-phosphoserine/phosphohydroxythreonine transaminase n=1 Tax=Ramlibacter sp. TaxID=1917967 RepID=UPI00260C7E0F|nr:3-phosphoserine/phosphohydroxythreonine transaminase [Ramlibacter sp.]MDH4375473.1 3-phosphoserine/phosphohydroxythreonine transaminase [Ramlibacter sp.]
MPRVFNFSPGPAALPETVLRQAAEEMLDWQGTGMSVMEMSHRGKEFMGIFDEAEGLLRELLGVPANYKVLFMQGGAIGENAIVPMNLIGRTGRADYLITGDWSRKSAKEAGRYGQVSVVADSAEPPGSGRCLGITPRAQWKLDAGAAYFHYCSNETIGGVQFHHVPDAGGVPLVADMSSDILSRPLDVSRFGLIYGGAQKNIGPSGLTLVIVRDDMLGHALPATPDAFNYRIQAEAGSMYNTPATYAIYIAGLVFKWIQAHGGLPAMAERNEAKARLLYDFLDSSRFFSNPIARDARSQMNVPFWLKDAGQDEAFLAGAQARGLVQLKGHRSVGGMRASIYNAMPIEGVQALVAYMKDFEASQV